MLKVLLLIPALIFFFGNFSLHGQLQSSRFVPIAPEILSNSSVRCFYKDDKGYIWLGTAEGLMRYDGTNVVRFEHDPSDPLSIPHNLVNAITQDSRKVLWIGTAKGVAKFNREQDNFINVDSIPGTINKLSSRFVTSLACDNLGNVWIGTHGTGLNVYDPLRLTFVHLLDSARKKGHQSAEYVTSLVPTDDGILCATMGGIQRYRTDKTLEALIIKGDKFPQYGVNQVHQDQAGNIWLASSAGDILKLEVASGYYICKTVVSSKNVPSVWSSIRALGSDKRGNLWLGGDNLGLRYLNTRTGDVTPFTPDPDQWGDLPTNNINSVYVDSTGLTWIGTSDHGAFLLDESSLKFNMHSTHADLKGLMTRGIAEDREGKIWFAFEGIGLAFMHPDKGKITYTDQVNAQFRNKFFTSLICDREGNLWAGTSGHGVYRYNVRMNRLENFPLLSHGLGENKTFCLYEDRNGQIWAGSSGSGLFHFDTKKNKFVVLEEKEIPNHITSRVYVSTIFQDSQRILWVGTFYGIYTITTDRAGRNNYQWYGQAGAGTLSSNGVQTIIEDSRSNIWVATSDNGINVRWKGQLQFQAYRHHDGLISNAVRGMVNDNRNNIWITTNAGLSRFDVATRSFTNYSRNDGLTSNSFSEHAALRTRRGILFFGNNNGFNSFHPDSLLADKQPPQVHLSELKINNQPVRIGDEHSPLTKHISLTSRIELTHRQRSFTIDFGTLNYSRGPQHNYCYKLEGFDSDWTCSSLTQSAKYTNIDPGRYVFLVRASSRSGVWSSTPTQIVIDVRPAPWESWWAIASYCVAGVIVLLVLFRIRVDKIRMKGQLQLERMAREKDRELLEAKTMFFTNVSHEIRTPLSLILLPIENLMTSKQTPPSVKGKLKGAQRNAEKMMTLVNELLDFEKTQSGSLPLHLNEGDIAIFISDVAEHFRDLAVERNIRFHVDRKKSALHGLFDAGKLEKIIFNLLSNAFKFTADAGEVQLTFKEITILPEDHASQRCLELNVIDNGIGIDEKEISHVFEKFYQAKSASQIANPGTGIGLALTRSLVELHGGNITVASSGGTTRFTVRLPIDQLHVQHQNGMKLNSRQEDSITIPNDDRVQILLVEDNLELRNYLASSLGGEFVVFEASDGKAGLELAREKIPDLVISDILMANKSGLELCKSLKSDIKTCHIPIILLTAKAGINEQIVGIESGADVYITKPFNYQYLITHVRNIIQSRKRLYAYLSKDVRVLPAKAMTNELDQEFLERLINCVNDHLQNTQLGVDLIADEFNLSRIQVYRKVKALTGKTVVEFIRTTRLKRAVDLMVTRKYTLSEVAYRTGFNSASYFSRSFRDEYGKAPSEYMERQDHSDQE